jgi:hypothetical protein
MHLASQTPPHLDSTQELRFAAFRNVPPCLTGKDCGIKSIELPRHYPPVNTSCWTSVAGCFRELAEAAAYNEFASTQRGPGRDRSDRERSGGILRRRSAAGRFSTGAVATGQLATGQSCNWSELRGRRALWNAPSGRPGRARLSGQLGKREPFPSPGAPAASAPGPNRER